MTRDLRPIEDVYQDLYSIDSDDGHKWWSGAYNYQPMLDSFGYEILVQVDDHDYQGDTRVLFYDYPNDRYGMLIFGWGSCSGCDALQACDTPQEVDDLRYSLYDGIQWKTKAEMYDYMCNHDWEGDYCWHMEETRNFIEQCKNVLK